MQTIQALTWQASANNLGPVSNVAIDFTLDTQWQFTHLAGSYGTVDVTPKFLTIENLNGDQRIDVVFDDSITYPVNPFQRLTVPVPPGGRRCLLTSIGSTPASIVATFAVDDLSAADNFNFKGISAVPAASALRPMDFYGNAAPAITVADLGRIKVMQNTVRQNIQLPSAQDPLNPLPNGFNFSIWVDPANASTWNNLSLSNPADVIVGPYMYPGADGTVGLMPGMFVNCYTDGSGHWYVEKTNPFVWFGPWTNVVVSQNFSFTFTINPLFFRENNDSSQKNVSRAFVDLQCVTAQLGYNSGDMPFIEGVDAATASSGFIVKVVGGDVGVVIGSSIQILRADTFVTAAITPANWRFRPRIILL